MKFRICHSTQRLGLLNPKECLHTFMSGARSIAKYPSTSFLSVSAPDFSSRSATSPCPSEIAINRISMIQYEAFRVLAKQTLVQSGISTNIDSVHGTFVIKQQLDHWYGAYSCSSVKRKLPAFVFDPSGRFVSYELSRCLKVVLGRRKMESCLKWYQYQIRNTFCYVLRQDG